MKKIKSLLLALVFALGITAVAAPASAKTGWPSDFTVTNGSIVYDSVFGGNVMNLPPSASNNGYSEVWSYELNVSWAGRTVVVCAWARSVQGSIQISNAKFGYNPTLNYSGNGIQSQCALVYNNVGGSVAKVYIRAYGSYNVKVRNVDIYPY